MRSPGKGIMACYLNELIEFLESEANIDLKRGGEQSQTVGL